MYYKVEEGCVHCILWFGHLKRGLTFTILPVQEKYNVGQVPLCCYLENLQFKKGKFPSFFKLLNIDLYVALLKTYNYEVLALHCY